MIGSALNVTKEIGNQQTILLTIDKKVFGEGISIEVSHALTYRNPGGITVASNRTTSLLARLTRDSTAGNYL